MSYWPWGLDYWKSGEWQVCQERLADLDKKGIKWNPARKELFRSLRNMRPEDVKVILLGQDPYPSRKHATGTAFCVPEDEDSIPPTLVTMLHEVEADGYTVNWTTVSTLWSDRGVLLWNVYPTCTTGHSNSHNWEEYHGLTWSILDKLEKQPLVIACLGGVAASVLREKDYQNASVITVSHPSPRASRNARHPFIGSKLFSRINTQLAADWNLPPIDWSIGDGTGQKLPRQGTAAPVTGALYENTTQEFTQGLSTQNTRQVRHYNPQWAEGTDSPDQQVKT